MKKYIPQGAARILAGMSPGDFVCRNSSDKEKGGYSYFIEPTGRHLNPISARWLIEKGEVIPCADGLFEGTSQSFRRKEIEPNANA